jgi:hypothetical protein
MSKTAYDVLLIIQNTLLQYDAKIVPKEMTNDTNVMIKKILGIFKFYN